MNISGTQGLGPEDIRAEVARGARFVCYDYCVSLFVLTLRRTTAVRYLRPGESGFGMNFFWSLFSLLFGWWGFPWGPVYTLSSLWTNLRGGRDLTLETLNLLPSAEGEAPLLPGQEATLHGAEPRGRWELGTLAACGTFAAALALLWGAMAGYSRTHMPVALVNGLSEPYTVTVNGTAHALPPHRTLRLELPEGPFEVSATLPRGAGVTRFSFNTDDTLNGSDKVTFINADGAAIVVEESTYYTVDNKAASEPPPPRLHVARRHWVLPEPDYFVDSFPSEVSMPKHQSVATRTRAYALAHYTPAVAADLIRNLAGEGKMVDYVRQLGLSQPGNPEVLQLAITQLDDEQQKAFFSQHLATRPLQVEWHRYHQNLVLRTEPARDLPAEYRKLLDAEPEQGDLAYLYGRLLDDPAQSDLWFKKGLAAATPSVHVHRGLGFNRYGEGRFEEALASIDKVLQAGVPPVLLVDFQVECLLALGRPAEALARLRALPVSSPGDYARVESECRLLYVAEGRAAVVARIDAYAKALEKEGQKDAAALARRWLGAELSYHDGDAAAYVAGLPEDAPNWARFNAALCERRLADAEALLTGEAPGESSAWLTLYIAAELAGAAEKTHYWSKSLEALAREGRSTRRVLQHLRGVEPLGVQELVSLPLYAREKRVLLTALALRTPEHREALLKGALRYNFLPDFPRHLIDQAARQGARTALARPSAL